MPSTRATTPTASTTLERLRLRESASSGKLTTTTKPSPRTHPTRLTCPSPRECSPSCSLNSADVLEDVDHALGPSAWAAKRATTTVPIVIAFSGDLVGTGMLSNLARPGGNITGFSYLSTDLAAKRLELLSETFSRS